jgi:hypothetical protein
MIDYKTNFNTNGSNFPATQAINVSTPGAGDGTEFKALMPNDHWGARQAIMDYASLTPNGSSETYSNSQFLLAITRSLSPAGTVFMSHTQQDPATLGYRFLELNGQGVLRANYVDLDSACYVGNTRNATAEYYFRADNSDGSSRNTTGAYLILADMRGAFARGYDPTATVDPDGVTRGSNFPDFQKFSMQTHLHEVDSSSNSWNAVAQRKIDTGTTWDGFEAVTSASSLQLRANENIVKVSGPGPAVEHNLDETRASNVAVKWWVRY